MLDALVTEIRACRVCADALAHEPRPVLRVSATARLLIVGQAPGARVHASGVPWDDPSGRVLRGWMGVDDATFYDVARIAIVPMGFCYPGTVAGGDLPPRPECAPLWHPRVLAALRPDLTMLLVGSYAQARYLGPKRGRTLTDTVRAFRDYGPRTFPLPHPSWRNRAWAARNPWFEAEVVPELRRVVAAATGG